MKVLGIIAEYNPFHNGHLYHMESCRKQSEADAVVIIMSGNFTQRGEPAVLDKWIRSRLAVECGADLVLELPVVYGVNSAEYFAKGGVGILSGLGCVTHLGFGTEQGNLQELENIAEFLIERKTEYQGIFKSFLKKGVSYAKAQEQAVQIFLGSNMSQLTVTPNNILALEYLKQLKIQNKIIKPIIVNRKGAGYFDAVPKQQIASATAIRHHLSSKEREYYVPPCVEEEMRKRPEISGYYDLVRSAVLRSSLQELAEILSVGEGLENRLKAQVRKASSIEELAGAVKSKRYPQTRIRRILCQTLLGIRPFEDTYYARVLAVGTEGKRLLREIKRKASIPVLTNINKAKVLPTVLKYDILASDMYNLLIGADLYRNSDYVMHPYIQSQE